MIDCIDNIPSHSIIQSIILQFYISIFLYQYSVQLQLYCAVFQFLTSRRNTNFWFLASRPCPQSISSLFCSLSLSLQQISPIFIDFLHYLSPLLLDNHICHIIVSLSFCNLHFICSQRCKIISTVWT